MTKLLEFKPKGKPEADTSTFVKYLDEDIWFGCTPDLPLIRYQKENLVFLWDDLTTTKIITRTLGVSTADYKTICFKAFTRDRFQPFINKGDATKVGYILPASPKWTLSLKDKALESEPKRIRGQVYNVSTRMLVALDNYYNNTTLHGRVKLPVNFGSADGEQKSVWVYVMPTNVFSKYKPHESCYELVRGFDPKRMSVNYIDIKDEGVYATTYMDSRK